MGPKGLKGYWPKNMGWLERENIGIRKARMKFISLLDLQPVLYSVASMGKVTPLQSYK